MANRNTLRAPTSDSDIFKIPKDDVGLWSLLCLPVPALLGDLPGRLGYSWSFKGAGFRWPCALPDRGGDVVLPNLGIGHLSGRELEMKTVGIWAPTLSGTDVPRRQPLTRSTYRTCSSILASPTPRYYREARGHSNGPCSRGCWSKRVPS